MSNPEQFYAINIHSAEWEASFNPKLGVNLGRLMLRKDPVNGAEIRMIRYPKGVLNPAHHHPCGHGIFVLEGTLRTHKGEFGPGTWVWFPQGEVMEHGATDDADVVGIFITDGAFEIHYEDDSERTSGGR